MTLVRWSPWRELDTFQRQMNRLLDDSIVPSRWQDTDDFPVVPAAELSETDHALQLKLELPGIEAKDLDIQVTEKSVSISGERKSETKSEEEGVTRSEFHYGRFQRVIPLPSRIQNTDVKAEYIDGILNLTLPKSEAERNKVVKVNLEKAAA